ncbi:MAG: peptidoglycan-binding protein [Myxococcota bacterium]
MSLAVQRPSEASSSASAQLPSGSTADLVAYFQLRMRELQRTGAQQEAFLAAVQSTLGGLRGLGGSELPPEAKQALLEASAQSRPLPSAVLKRLGVNVDTLSAQNPLVDLRVASRGQNLGVYSQGPSLSDVAQGRAVLHIGHQGEAVKEVQRQLNALGAKLAVDGMLGPRTEAAIKDFKAARGLSGAGLADAATLRALERGGPSLGAAEWKRFTPAVANKTRGALDAAEVYNERAAANADRAKQGVAEAKLAPGAKGLLERIAIGEGTSDAIARQHGYKTPPGAKEPYDAGYDVALAHGAFGGGPNEKPISSMTLGEVKALQDRIYKNPRNGWNSNPVGKYQIIGPTLKGLQKSLNLSDDTVFSPEIQDKMGMQLLRQRGLDKYQAGQMSADAFQREIAGEWASIADPATKRSRYGQATGTSDAEAKAAIASVRQERNDWPAGFKPAPIRGSVRMA